MTMNETARVETRAALVEAFDNACYLFRSGGCSRDDFVAEVKDLKSIGATVGWEPHYEDVAYAAAHRMAAGTADG